jgi:predicted secreted protein
MLSPENIESAPAGMVGAPSLIVTRFKAKKAGQTAVDLGYYRPWESPATASDHFQFHLVIKP